MVKHCNDFRVSLAVLYATTIYLNYAESIQVISTGPQTIKKAQGENVTLGCTYVQSPSDTGQLDVEWSNVSPDMTQKDRLILSYSGGTVYKLGDPGLMSRLKCVGDPGQGDASIFISPLQASDTATYECKVKKPPGIDSRKVTLVVLVRPSVPKCWVDNGEEIGSTIILRCKSSEGTSPLKYNWIRESGGSLPPTATQNPQTGELLIQNHSQSYTGSYLCEVTNEVGKEQCKYSLRAYSSANKAGVIAGAVIGALLLLLLLLLLIWLLICCCQKRRKEKDTANEIREDAAAPESRYSSFRSMMGYHPHQGLAYSSVRNAQPYRAESNRSSSYTNHSKAPPQGSSSANNYKPPQRYSSKHGYPV